MKNKLVTVCIPAYNHENFVEEAVESIINQTYQNIELYIVNDGSTDNTDEKIRNLYDKCKKRFPTFEYINRENRGLMPTLNEVLHRSYGDYFVMMASDDIAIESKIEKQVACLESSSEYAICFGRAVGIDENSKRVSKYKNKYKNYKSTYTFEDLIVTNVIAAPTVMLRRDVLLEVGGYDERFRLEDLPLWLKISKKYPVKYMDEDLIYYRDHATNVSKDIIFMIKEKERILLDWKSDPYYKIAMKKHNLYTFSLLVKAKQKELAKEYLLPAFYSSWYSPKFIRALVRYFL